MFRNFIKGKENLNQSIFPTCFIELKDTKVSLHQKIPHDPMEKKFHKHDFQKNICFAFKSGHCDFVYPKD